MSAAVEAVPTSQDADKRAVKPPPVVTNLPDHSWYGVAAPPETQAFAPLRRVLRIFAVMGLFPVAMVAVGLGVLGLIFLLVSLLLG